ncbi:MAG: glucosamine-6-phosphate deaminase [Clostridia bacterium]|nr:glucosamine-6-phosphate deaminase [Clostridia bacterium]
MRFYVTEDYAQMSRRAASIIAAQVVAKPDCVLGLATGSSPVGAYQNLVKWNKEGILSFAEVRSVNLDEYIGLSPEHEQSYRYFMQDNLFNHIDIKPENTNVPNGLAADPDQAAVDYEKVIASMNGVDLQLLGMGHNGHIAFNEPCDEFIMDTHVVELTESTIKVNARFFASMDEVPRKAMTMGIRSIMKAKKILVVVAGADKAEAVYKSFAGPVNPQVPASILQLHADVTVVGDKAAMSKLIEAGLAK